MGIKKYKPTTPSLRFTELLTFEEITTNKPGSAGDEDRSHRRGIVPKGAAIDDNNQPAEIGTRIPRTRHEFSRSTPFNLIREHS